MGREGAGCRRGGAPAKLYSKKPDSPDSDHLNRSYLIDSVDENQNPSWKKIPDSDRILTGFSGFWARPHACCAAPARPVAVAVIQWCGGRDQIGRLSARG